MAASLHSINIPNGIYPDTFSNLNSCGHNRDARTAIEYGQDLVASWLFRPDMPLRKNVKEQRL